MDEWKSSSSVLVCVCVLRGSCVLHGPLTVSAHPTSHLAASTPSPSLSISRCWPFMHWIRKLQFLFCTVTFWSQWWPERTRCCVLGKCRNLNYQEPENFTANICGEKKKNKTLWLKIIFYKSECLWLFILKYNGYFGILFCFVLFLISKVKEHLGLTPYHKRQACLLPDSHNNTIYYSGVFQVCLNGTSKFLLCGLIWCLLCALVNSFPLHSARIHI